MQLYSSVGTNIRRATPAANMKKAVYSPGIKDTARVSAAIWSIKVVNTTG